MANDLKVSDLKRGDIVFFAPRARNDLSVFPQLAAFVQAWPYSEDKPWYHVAVATAPTTIVDFSPSTPSGSRLPWATYLDVRPITDEDKTILNALRMSEPADAEKLATAAETMKGRAYTEPGLLAFAAASQARLFRAGTARETLYNFAAGFEELAADPAEGIAATGYTCVTAVTTALKDSRVLPGLQVEEPAPLQKGPDSRMTTSIVNLYDVLKPGQRLLPAIAQAKAAAAVPSAGLMTLNDVKRGYQANPGQMVAFAPGELFDYTHEYIETLADTILQLRKTWSSLQLVNAGQSLRSGAWPTPGSWAVSPAMLYDGLVGAGAQPV
jgi:hypothetical protein